jgi:hypothetical protein
MHAKPANPIRGKVETASYILNGKQLSPPEKKFGKGYEHGKSHFSTEI